MLKISTFFLISLLILSCVSQIQVQNQPSDFYFGLLNDSIAEKIKLFERALASPNGYIRQAAAEKLVVLMAGGAEIPRKTMESVRGELRGFWAEAFHIVSAPDKEKALSFFFNHDNNSASFSEAMQFIIRECVKKGITFSEREIAAIEGHYSVSCLRYNEALDFFRIFQFEDHWPELLPNIFIEYPILINDLGKTFQYTKSSAEGLTLFLQWLKNKELSFDLQYRLNFYAGRIARRIGGKNAQGIALFEHALTLAPDTDQLDACIWYILDLTITGPTKTFIDRLAKYIPQWRKGSDYNDLLERFLHKLVAERDWNKVIKTYDLIKNTGAAVSKIGYAWVIGRAIENKYLTAADTRLAAQAIGAKSANAAAFYRIAYDVGIVNFLPSLLYRSKCADALKEPFFEFTEEVIEPENIEYSQALQFILGFFNYGVVDFSYPYIKEMERELTADELRVAAQAFDKEGIHWQSIHLASLYVYRDGYSRDRRDWELMFPRPYLELVEKYSQEYGIAPSLLYGLIRTESAFREAVVSRAGAVGLMQLMPKTAKDMAERLRRTGGPDYFSEDGVVDSRNPSLNIHIGTYYFKYLQDYFKDTILALLAYNGGQNRVRRLRNASKLPIDLFVETITNLENRDYGKRVPAAARVYQELYYKDR
ncbi:flagellar assembly lytic transglycosylase [Treponema sp. R8-4-B8]